MLCTTLVSAPKGHLGGADHVTQVCEAHNQVIMSFLQQVQGGARPTTEGSRGNRDRAQCARVRR